jgi:hypothetical protein
VGQQTLHRCVCCGYRTGCTTCPICYWTDDRRNDLPSSNAASNLNTDLSLADARLNFSIYGASATPLPTPGTPAPPRRTAIAPAVQRSAGTPTQPAPLTAAQPETDSATLDNTRPSKTQIAAAAPSAAAGPFAPDAMKTYARR